ncbi:MAG: TetR/AcrR family transcriptional regulator [Niabella sp.]
MLTTENKVLKKALFLFTEHGPGNTAMNEIASGAGISKKTLYKCFESKAALVNTLYARILNRAELKLRKTLDKADNAVLEFLNICRQVLSFYYFFPPIVLTHLKYADVEIYDEITFFRKQFLPVVLSYNIERGIGCGLYKKDIDSNIVAHFVLTQLSAFNHGLNFLRHQYADKYIQQQLLAHLLYGIVSFEGSHVADSCFSDHLITVQV